tara:strand:+ start:1131 stop:1898 length:768 start_codon:yes stop_codon:yes gene_type:complete
MLAGNWKMNLDFISGNKLVEDIVKNLETSQINKNIEIVFSPSYIHLQKVTENIQNYSNLNSSAQDISMHEKGSFTGEISCEMIKSIGAKYTLLGHSERRSNFLESSKILKKKIELALSYNLNVIYCCGETMAQRDSGLFYQVIESQIEDVVFHSASDDISKIVIAYEPVWAIGTGKNANPQQAEDMHQFIRTLISKKFGNNIAENLTILYGGSCNVDNAKDLFSQPNIDGGLIGGASLDVDSFCELYTILCETNI